MNRMFWKKVFDESNLLIIIPAIVVVGSLVWFLVFGLSDPKTTNIDSLSSIVDTQNSYETNFINQYNSSNYSKENPFFILNPYKMSPLSGLLMFSVPEQTTFKVVVKGIDEEADIEYITGNLTEHFIPIYGLYAGIINTVELYEMDGINSFVLVSTTSVETSPLPEDIKLPSVIDTTYEYFEDDLMVTMSSNSNYPVGYDYNGDVRWYFSEELSWSAELLKNGHMLLGGRNLASPYYSSELLEIDYLGKVYAQYVVPSGYHHDFTELIGGNLLIATNDIDGTFEDIIIELDRETGEIVKKIDLSDIINSIDGASEMTSESDWFHLNSIDYYLLEDSLILSGSHQDIVISIDANTSEINWILGDPTDWDVKFSDQNFLTPVGDNFAWQYGQNGVTVLENGDIFLFDNGINKSKIEEEYLPKSLAYSRGVIYSINRDLKTVEQVFEYGKELGTSFYSSYNSNVEYYYDGNYLIHSGGIGTVNEEVMKLPIYFEDEYADFELKSITLELDEGIEVYRMEMDDNIYQAKRISLYENVENHVVGLGISVGYQLETPRFFGTINRTFNMFDTVPLKYDIELYKEFDRFVIEGTFDKDSLVYVLLENNSETNKYFLPTESCTFMTIYNGDCINEKVYITHYINDVGMNGKYNIYLIIDGKKYDTYKTVTFE